jgi:glycyl-tRNA synthetase beta chain
VSKAKQGTLPFILEIGSEELPQSFIEPAATALAEQFAKLAEDEKLSYSSVQSFGTPRRLSLLVHDLSAQQSDRFEEILGPPISVAYTPDGSPTKAASSFAERVGVPVQGLVSRPGKRGEVLAAVVHHVGRNTGEVLSERLPLLISALTFPKTMRWEMSGFRFARPIRWIVALLGDEVIPFEVAGVAAGRESRGHRLLSNHPVELRDPQNYVTELLRHWVMVDPSARQERIAEGITQLSDGEYRVVPDEELLRITANLVEWPRVALGEFEKHSLVLPRRVLTTVLRHHQKIFAVEDSGGNLTNRFAVVLGTEPSDLAQVLKGNARVIRARLDDAYYFFTADSKRPLDDRVKDLARVIYLKGLGSVLDRTERLKVCVELWADLVRPGLRDTVVRAAHLSKADLTTSMVFEFPELQGVMGHYYALLSGETPEVAQAVEEHYKPRFAEDSLPSNDVSALLALADKAETIAGCYALGLQPKGGQDPYGLRRAAIGLVRILEDRGYDVSFRTIIDDAFGSLERDGIPVSTEERNAAKEFVEARARVIYSERFAPDIVDAVLASGHTVPHNIVGLLEALHRARIEGWFDSAAVAFKRIQNISRNAAEATYDAGSLTEGAELDLEAAFTKSLAQLNMALEQRDYAQALSVLVHLKPAVDNFFDKVLVMTDDQVLRRNRLGLLRVIAANFFRIADFTRIREELPRLTAGT